MTSSLNSALLQFHRHDTADAAHAVNGAEKSPPSSLPYPRGQFPPPDADEAADLHPAATKPKPTTPSLCTDDGRHACYLERNQREPGRGEEEEQEGLISRQKSRLVWDGSGFLPGNSELRSESEGVRSNRMLSLNPKDELRRFHCSLFWVCLDQSTPLRTVVSWAVVFLLAIAIPIFYMIVVDMEESSSHASHPFDRTVQVSEAALALISFGCLSHNLRKHGLRSFLFLDQISLEPTEVQTGYIGELNRAFRLLQLILLPSFLIELVHQVWWFTCATINFPLIQSSAFKSVILCFAVMVSWVYKTTVFLLPCILFRLMCYLQNLRFEGYINMLETVPEVSAILMQYMRLRQQLNTISHRFRMFIILSLVCITASQFMFLLMITASSTSLTPFTAGDLVACSVVQLIGFAICLHGAARITHRAQRIVSIVSQWHAISTCQHYEATRQDNKATNCTSISWVDEPDQLASTEYDPDLSSALNMSSTTFTGVSNNDIAAFQMRQAFVWYIQQDQAGISLFGYKLDRSFVYALASVELSLLLFILGLTIGMD